MDPITDPAEGGRRLPGALRVAGVLVAALLLAAGVRLALGGQLEPKVAFGVLTSVQERWFAAPLFLLVYVGATGLLLPAVLFHMLSGAAWGFGPGLALNLLAVNVSASAHFHLARWLGRARVERLLAGRSLSLFDGVASQHGVRAVVAIRMLPLPHLVVNVAAGISKMRWRDFALGSLVGTLPILLIYTYFASSLVQGVEGVERRALWHTAVAGALVLLFTLGPRLLTWVRTIGKSPVA